MFGVFSAYELQVIHDWIRGAASADGQAFTEAAPPAARRPSFRAAQRLAALVGTQQAAAPDEGLLDTDLHALQAQLAALDAAGRSNLLLEAMSPAQHWTPAGLHATRLFCEALHG